VPIEGRPGDILEPELPKAKEALAGISDRMEDILIYALYPMTGLEFLKKRKLLGAGHVIGVVPMEVGVRKGL
jgi:pyruvate/oxaloacetate carboxyltransferase